MRPFWRARRGPAQELGSEIEDAPAFVPDPRMEHVFDELARDPEMDDADFDRIYPEWYRSRSRLHWTPLPVIRRALELLIPAGPVGPIGTSRPAPRILDAGSGAGKFCLAGSVLRPRARFTGVEQRPHFVSLCRDITRHYGLYRRSGITWVLGDIGDVDWSVFDGVYLFNPFQEHKTRFQRIDSSIPLSEAFYREHVRATERMLGKLQPGSRVVTYHGFGGAFPSGFRRVVDEFCFRGPLQCWVRESVTEDPSTGSGSPPRG